MMSIRNILLRLCFSAGVLSLFSGCHAAEVDTIFDRPLENQWLDAAKELAHGMREAAANERFAKLFISDGEVLEYIREIGAADYSELQKVTVASVPRGALMAGFLDRTFAAEDIDTAAYRRIAGLMETRIHPAVVVSALNGREGSTHLAACAVLTESRTYIRPRDWREDLLLVMDYGGEYAVAVAFWQSGEETVTGQATFVLSGSVDNLFETLGEFCGESTPSRILTGSDLKKESI